MTLTAVSVSQYFTDTMSSSDLNSMVMFWSDVLEFWILVLYSCISGLVACVVTIDQYIGDEMRYTVIEDGALLDYKCFGQVMYNAGPDVCFQFDSTFGYPGEGPILRRSTKLQSIAKERGMPSNVERREKRAEEMIKEVPSMALVTTPKNVKANERRNVAKRRKIAERANKDIPAQALVKKQKKSNARTRKNTT